MAKPDVKIETKSTADAETPSKPDVKIENRSTTNAETPSNPKIRMKTRKEVIDIKEIIPLEDRVIPLLYKNETVTRDAAIELLQTNCGAMKQCNSLVYNTNQMPTGDDARGWKHVIRPPADRGEKLAYRIQTRPLEGSPRHSIGHIFVEYLPYDKIIPPRIKEATESLLSKHTAVEDTEGETGRIVSNVKRVDFVPCSSTTKNEFDDYGLRKHLTGPLMDIVASSIASKSISRRLESSIGFSSVVSEDVTNSIHRDVDDYSRSFGLFFPRNPEKPGTTFFLFPSFGVAIELTGSVILSYEGYDQPHCSCTVTKGVYDAFITTKTRHVRHARLEKAFDTGGHSRTFSEGDRIIVRQQVRELESMGATLPGDVPVEGKKHDSQKWKRIYAHKRATFLFYLDATVLTVRERQLEIQFNDEFKELGPMWVYAVDARPEGYIDSVLLEHEKVPITKQQKKKLRLV